MRWVGNAAAPAPLVEAVGGDAALSEIGEEPVVAVYVVVEAVDKDELCFRGSVGLKVHG